MTWAGIAAAVVGAGTAAYSASQQGGGESGYDVISPPFSNELAGLNYQNQQKSSAYLQSMLAQLQAGNMPAGMATVLDQIRQRKMQELHQDMYGRPGQPGGSRMDATDSTAALGGLGPKQLTAARRTAYQDYGDRQKQVTDFMDQNKFNYMDKASLVIPQLMMSSQQPQKPQVVPYSMPGQQGVDLSGLNNIDFSKIFKPQQQDMGGGGYSQYGNYYGSNTPAGVRDQGTWSSFG